MNVKDIAMIIGVVCVVVLLFAAGGMQAMKGFAKDINGSKHIVRLYSWVQAMAVVLALILAGVILYNR